MIVKIDLSQIYDMNSKLILPNKYRRVEGNLFEVGYSLVTVDTGSGGSGTTTSSTSADGRVFSKAGPSSIGRYPYMNDSWGLKIFTETTTIEIAHSTSDPVMQTKTSDFFMDLTANGKKVRYTHTPTGWPSTSWDRPARPVNSVGSASMYKSAAESLLGNAGMTVLSADYYNAKIRIEVITKVEVWDKVVETEGGPASYYSPFDGGTVQATYNLSFYNYSILNNTFYNDSNPYVKGATDKKYNYKYPDNMLITEQSKFDELSLIEKLFDTVIANYFNGKQVIKLSVAMDDYVDDKGNKLENHIFELGQYVQLYNDNTPLVYYKLTNICKTLEIVGVEFVNEQWNLVLREVAKVGTN